MEQLNIVNITSQFLRIDYGYRDNADGKAPQQDDAKVECSEIHVLPQKHLQDSTLFQLVLQAKCSIEASSFSLQCEPRILVEFALESDERFHIEDYLRQRDEEISRIFYTELRDMCAQLLKLTPTATNKYYGALGS